MRGVAVIDLMKSSFLAGLLGALLLLAAPIPSANAAGVKPGDTINKDNAAQAQDLLSPGNLVLVQRGMQIHVIASDKAGLAAAVQERQREVCRAGLARFRWRAQRLYRGAAVPAARSE